MNDLEQTLLDAFRLAENSRKAAGFAPRKLQDMVTRKKDGTKWTGPPSYFVGLWVRPWHYANMMMAKANSAKPDQSLTKFIQDTLERVIPQVATRPEPKQPKNGIASLDNARTKREKLRPGQTTPEERGARMGNHILAKVAAAQRAR